MIYTQVQDGQALPSNSGDMEHTVMSETFGLWLAVGYEHLFDIGYILFWADVFYLLISN